MTNKNGQKYFYVVPRNQTYGGIMHAIVNAFPIAKYLNKKIKVVDVRINNKKKSPLFIKHVANISSYKNLGYGNEKLYFNGIDILFKKIDFLIKALINKYLIFSLLVKLIFVLKYLNIKKAKIKFREYFNTQNYYDGEDWNEKNFLYLKKQNIDFNKTSLQKIFINRDIFFLKKEPKKSIEKIKNLLSDNLKNKFICFYIRENKYDKNYSFLEKNVKKIWYSEKDFLKSLTFLQLKNINIFNIGTTIDNSEINLNNYFDLSELKIKSEIFNYFLSENCKFFLSTGGGKSELSRLFKKPILRVDHEYNVLHNFNYSTVLDHVIFCNVYSKLQKRFLSIEEQFKNLEKIFPLLKNNFKFFFNHEDYKLVKNNEDEIYNLVLNHNFDKNKINQIKEEQNEIFDIKKFYIKKNCPDSFYFGTTRYPDHPIICSNFFKKTKKYSDYLENKTVNFNRDSKNLL